MLREMLFDRNSIYGVTGVRLTVRSVLESLIWQELAAKNAWCRFDLCWAPFLGAVLRGVAREHRQDAFRPADGFSALEHLLRGLLPATVATPRVRTLCRAEQYRAMAFAQLTYRESLRDIEVCYRRAVGSSIHIGFREPVRRSTLADANETRDWRIYAEFAHRLIAQARKLYARRKPGHGAGQHGLCSGIHDHRSVPVAISVGALSLTKAAVKMHTLLDLRGNIPSSSASRTASCTTSTYFDLLLPEAAPSMSWIAATSTSRGFTSCIKLAPSSLPVQSRTWMRTASTRADRSGDRYHCRPDYRIGWLFYQQRLIPFICAASNSRISSGKGLVFLITVLPSGGIDLRPIQEPLAGRTVLQMDKAASLDQAVLRHVGTR